MIDTVHKWLPLYMTGAISPYFCPKLRDGIFHHTLFVAEEETGIVSSSVIENPTNSLSIMITKPDAVKALKLEFDDLLKLCRPLLYVFHMNDQESYHTISQSFLERNNNTTVMTPLFSPYTMPKSIKEKETFDNIFYECRFCDHFEHTMSSGCTLTEISYLPPLDIKNGISNVPLKISQNGKIEYYTKDQLLLHLTNTLHILQTNENYHLILTNNYYNDFLITCKDEVGVFIHHLSSSPIAFMINEPRVTSTFVEYFFFNIVKFEDKQQTINELIDYINELKK